jgi:hypothetical protein
MVERIYRDDDTSVTRGFELDPFKIIGSGLQLLPILAVLIAFPSFGGESWISYAVCGCLVVGVAMLFALNIRNFYKFRGDVVVISPEGILDRRMSDQTIPWSVITDIRSISYRRLKIMLLTVDPVFDATFKRKTFGPRSLDKAFGVDGVHISADFLLHVSHEELLATTRAYAEAALARQAGLGQTQATNVGSP